MAKELTESRRTRYTRRAIQDAFIDLLREKPLGQITVSELCERADVNRSTFYAHYSSLQDLLHTIENETIDWVSHALEEMSNDANSAGVEQSIERVCEYIAQNSNHLQVLMSPRADIDFQRRLIGLLYDHHDQMAHLQANNETPLESAMHMQFAIHGSIGLIQYWLANGLQASPKEIARTIIEMGMPDLSALSHAEQSQ